MPIPEGYKKRYAELREKYGTYTARMIVDGEVLIEQIVRATNVDELKPILIKLVNNRYPRED